jgi:hypothetical protein
MSDLNTRRSPSVNAETIFHTLSTRQHLGPHRALKEVLAEAQTEAGFCPDAAERAVQWLRLDTEQSIGRLRRSELMQLAQSIHRFWRQSVPSASQPV